MENNSLCESDEIYQQNYKNEKQNGPYKEYYDDGKLKLETTLNEGLYEGFCKYYWESGQLREECFYTILDIDGVKESFLEGPCIKWGALDNKTKEFSYIIIDREEGIKESVYHGEYKEYNYSGELHIFCNYNKGVREGKYILFSFMGYKQQECFYINDKLDGLYEEWFIPLGYRRDEKSDNQYKLKKRLYYKNGEYEGSYEYWYNNGNKRVECFYKNKQLDGPFKEWDNRGNLTFEETYINGVSSKDILSIKSLEKCIDFLYSSQTDGLTNWSEQEYIDIMNTLKYCKELIEDEDDEGTISELAEIISELEDEENND